jgi:hypothetical protein
MKGTYTFIIFLCCNLCCTRQPKVINIEKPFFEYTYSNWPYNPFTMKFKSKQTVDLYNDRLFTKCYSSYSIYLSDRATLDSFITILSTQPGDESYIETHPQDHSVEEGHFYNFTIRNNASEKNIWIAGHTAPERFHAFAEWAYKLMVRLVTSEKGIQRECLF